MPTPRRLLLALAAGFAASGLFAQTYVGNLNGTHADSTLELVTPGNVNLPAAGWTALSGSPRIFDAGVNDAILNGDGQNYAPFSVQYVATGNMLVPNSSYTLSFRMGYFSGPSTGNANYSFELGTWNGAAFTSLQAVSGGPVVYSGSFSADGNNSTTVSLNYSTGASVSSDTIAVRWAQTNTSSGADFMGFDHVTLSYSAVPEPSTYAAIFGGVALAGAMIHRRRRPAALSRDR